MDPEYLSMAELQLTEDEPQASPGRVLTKGQHARMLEALVYEAQSVQIQADYSTKTAIREAWAYKKKFGKPENKEVDEWISKTIEKEKLFKLLLQDQEEKRKVEEERKRVEEISRRAAAEMHRAKEVARANLEKVEVDMLIANAAERDFKFRGRYSCWACQWRGVDKMSNCPNKFDPEHAQKVADRIATPYSG